MWSEYGPRLSDGPVYQEVVDICKTINLKKQIPGHLKLFSGSGAVILSYKMIIKGF